MVPSVSTNEFTIFVLTSRTETYTVSGHKYFITVRIPIDFSAFFSVQEN